ncbi:pyruvate dehydrogenase [Pseudomonas aeruginosa]|nr:pyruvate dehydrogenase [Pseudomonas aeruginosa]
MSSKKVAEIVVETLEAAGIRHCYGIVGDTLNHVTDAIHRSQIQWVHVRHEEAAAFAAGAESYVSGRLTACAGSCGPGSLHFINGVYEAQRNRAPMVLIASQIVTPQLGMEFPRKSTSRRSIPVARCSANRCTARSRRAGWWPWPARRRSTGAAWR